METAVTCTPSRGKSKLKERQIKCTEGMRIEWVQEERSRWKWRQYRISHVFWLVAVSSGQE
jgi:hypothetical protein